MLIVCMDQQQYTWYSPVHPYTGAECMFNSTLQHGVAHTDGIQTPTPMRAVPQHTEKAVRLRFHSLIPLDYLDYLDYLGADVKQLGKLYKDAPTSSKGLKSINSCIGPCEG